MILSLAARYSPDTVGMILVDTERRFVEYDGVHSFGELAHVLMVVDDIDQIESLQSLLQETAVQLRETHEDRHLFVFIDNYDDFEKELGTRQAQAGLASMARRFGRDGLHFVIAGSMDDTPQDLRRRILASGFGIGLRTETALGPFRMMRLPAELRGKELNPGRGYLVQAGRPTLLQVATPYPVVTEDVHLSHGGCNDHPY